uniref:Uncharacterized protein n=1 Tax=Ralstonia solanacearum TaxID=305 RepID=A0A0S4X2U5_RALSL|nr:protein of unknown function [Ralstonia solanacearum]CUV58345.1 protein of unknown function [Ralstonia solanacearum]CUV63212.1 protein of unknown function [Ralstonia solanacearum]
MPVVKPAEGKHQWHTTQFAVR